mmetsp:Transcript_7322/g.22401  ORF Transcript_7322/g.22401 Transcript_7322/m.22401 type:complete len:126 (-) Transcript_7322:25-402(-)
MTGPMRGRAVSALADGSPTIERGGGGGGRLSRLIAASPARPVAASARLRRGLEASFNAAQPVACRQRHVLGTREVRGVEPRRLGVSCTDTPAARLGFQERYPAAGSSSSSSSSSPPPPPPGRQAG